MQINDSNFPPGEDLFVQIRSAFVAKKTTFYAWCKRRGVNGSNARQAIYGTWNGPKGKQIRMAAIKDSGVTSAKKGGVIMDFKSIARILAGEAGAPENMYVGKDCIRKHGKAFNATLRYKSDDACVTCSKHNAANSQAKRIRREKPGMKSSRATYEAIQEKRRFEAENAEVRD